MITKNLRDKIIDEAKKLGCDCDGDMIVFKGVYYYVHIGYHKVKKVKKLKRLKDKEK